MIDPALLARALLVAASVYLAIGLIMACLIWQGDADTEWNPLHWLIAILISPVCYVQLWCEDAFRKARR